MAATAAGLTSMPGSEPPDHATARSPARWLNQPSAICDRPALCTQRKSTVGKTVGGLALDPRQRLEPLAARIARRARAGSSRAWLGRRTARSSRSGTARSSQCRRCPRTRVPDARAAECNASRCSMDGRLRHDWCSSCVMTMSSAGRVGRQYRASPTATSAPTTCGDDERRHARRARCRQRCSSASGRW